MRKFELWRSVDVNGVSGTGIVAEGVEFSDGTAAMRWKTEIATTSVAPSVNYFNYIHGHDGATRLVWVNDELLRMDDEVVVNNTLSKHYGRSGKIVVIDIRSAELSVRFNDNIDDVLFFSHDELFRVEPVLTDPSEV